MPPVAQKVQPMPQPICEETHTVIRPLALPSASCTIATVSTSAPSLSLMTSLKPGLDFDGTVRSMVDDGSAKDDAARAAMSEGTPSARRVEEPSRITERQSSLRCASRMRGSCARTAGGSRKEGWVGGVRGIAEELTASADYHAPDGCTANQLRSRAAEKRSPLRPSS